MNISSEVKNTNIKTSFGRQALGNHLRGFLFWCREFEKSIKVSSSEYKYRAMPSDPYCSLIINLFIEPGT